MNIKKHLSFTPLVGALAALIRKMPDKRKKGSVDYTLHQIIMTAFACMYMQSPSLLRFQKLQKKRSNRNNLDTLFNLKRVPGESAIRDNLSCVSADDLAPIFKNYLGRLQRNNYLKMYQFLDGKYLLTLDGTDYFSSKKVNCSECLQQKHRNGTVTYSHKVVQGAIVSPGRKQVFPLMPEEVRNTDGNTKQDCETNAAKRLIPQVRRAHPKLPFIWLADSLYATNPIIEDILDHNEDYIFAAKPGDHKTLYENIKKLEFNRKNTVDTKGRTFIHEWGENIPLTKHGNIKVNVMRLIIVSPQKNGENKSQYIGTWITSLNITSENIVHLVTGARSRWKIENECFNTLKNQGYCLEHNYGHREGGFSFNFYALILLAFYVHQILELTDRLHKKARALSGPLYAFWENARAVFNFFINYSWEELLQRIIDNEEDLWVPEKDPPSVHA